MVKKFFRCKVCGDIHFGQSGPEICPTCMQKNTYIEINKDDAKRMLGM
jgi:rubrerythrin